MIHARTDYDVIQAPHSLIPEDEPVFILRGQDELAPELLLRWAAELRLRGGQVEMAEAVEKHAQRMLEWQRTHVSKLPNVKLQYLRED